MRSVLSILNWIGYALVWFVLIFVPILAFAGWLTDVAVSTYSSGEASTTAVSAATDLVLWAAALMALVLWIYVLWRRVSLYWLKWPALGLLALSLVSPILSVVFLIGLGKFLIGSVGRWNLFAGSRLSSLVMAASPRGLVGNPDYD